MSEIIDTFKQTIESIHRGALDRLEQLYAADVQFTDPFHAMQGLDQVRDYLLRVKHSLLASTVTFEHEVALPGEAVLTWSMHPRPRRISRTRQVCVHGASHIRYDDKVYYQRDYFDTSTLLSSRVPLLHALIGSIRAAVLGQAPAPWELHRQVEQGAE